MTAASVGSRPVPAEPRRARREPRNYLGASEHRRLFWMFMPPALALVVVLELLTRSDPPPGPPREAQVDTRLEVVAGRPPRPDEVVIEDEEEPFEAADTSALGASLASLARVRDATPFRAADHDAWFEMWLTLEGHDGRRPPRSQAVGFTELFSQPRSFRGRAVALRGTLRRLEKLDSPPNDYGVKEYWQGWLEPSGGPASPVAVHFLRLPAEMPAGLEIEEPVAVEGLFLKNMAYVAGDGLRVAPLILSAEPVRRVAAPAADDRGLWVSLGVAGVATMLAIVSMIAVGFAVVGRGRRRAAAASDLDATLAGVQPFSVNESLRRLAAEQGGADVAEESTGA